jgi:CheY-like chemotaxis protein
MHAKRRVLILDDNKDVADSLGHVIRLEGHDVCVCYGAADALRSAHSFGPEVCILDIGLPESDGRQVARTLRATYGLRVILIALSGRAMPAEIAADPSAMFDHCLEKPASIETLLALLPQARNQAR